MPTAHSLVAPTQKMSDDTPYRQSGPQAVAPQSIPPENNRHISHPPQMPAPIDARSITTRPGPGAPPNSIPPQNYSIPPQNHSIPPQNAPLGSTPPAGHSMPPQRQPSQPPRISSRAATAPAPTPAPSQRGRAQTPAESVAATPPGRRWGLILFVLLLDIGLAASGAWMLSQGLAN
jgi:hypothetical protein